MNFSDIVALLERYLLLGIAAAVFLNLVFVFMYFIVYKKLLKGKKIISPFKFILLFIFVCYFTLIFGAVCLCRINEIKYHIMNLLPLTLFREAWYTSSAVLWRNLILNIVSFIPFGILLPLLLNQMRKLWITVGIGFAFSLMIESVQYITGTGQASTDDIITNTLGVLIGYGLAMTMLNIINKTERKPLKIIGYLSPAFSVLIIFATIFIAYQTKDFGNLSIAYYNKQNMNDVELSSELELSEKVSFMHVFQIESFNKLQAYSFAEQFFSRIGESFNDERGPAVYYDESAYFYSGNGILTVYYKGKTYDYTNFFSASKTYSSMNEKQVRLLLSEYNINIPKDAEFTNYKNGQYGFDMKNNNAEQKIVGSLTCEILGDETIREISNNLLECKSSNEYKIISLTDAFNKIKVGEFYYNDEYGEKLKTLHINEVNFDYRLDSKGFYQPIYCFNSLINNNYEYIIEIPAL